jgi:uncharacterized protein YtpQ (UPF0354 family)
MIESHLFRDRVLAIVRELFPDVAFLSLDDDPEALLAGQIRIGLQNLRAKFQLGDQTEEEFRDLVEGHFKLVLQQELPALDTFTLDEIRPKIFPQVMPAAFVEAGALPLVSYPLASEIRIGLVADFPQTYMYLREEDLRRWEVSQDAVYEMALENLEDASGAVNIQLFGSGTETFMAIASGDGYDAVRILTPGFQQLFSSNLGETFRFGIPNRDFLICWRIDCPETFHQQMQSQIKKDHSERPYPLSSSVFVRN